MSRPYFACALACLLVLAGCDGDDPTTDAGGGGGTDSGMGMTGTDSGTGGGTDAGMMTGTDAGGGGGTDAGPTGTDAGPPPGTDAGPPPACDMGRIRIQDDCGSFTACGGDLVGDWCYSDICITPSELIAQITNIDTSSLGAFAGLVENCLMASDEIELVDPAGTIEGTITVTETQITRVASNTTTGRVILPPPCRIVSCGITAMQVNNAVGAGTLTDCSNTTAGGCDCAVSFSSDIDESTGYTRVAASTIMTTPLSGSGQRIDYCVNDASNLVFRDNSADPTEPGTQTALPDGA